MNRFTCLALALAFVTFCGSTVAPSSAQPSPLPAVVPPLPCSLPVYHQFDFWLGDWTVRSAGGKLQGTNHVTREYNGCVLQEHWLGAGGGVGGTSFNVYDASRRLWHQTWVDGTGNLLVIEGALRDDGTMLMQGNATSRATGKPYVQRIAWTPLSDGRVRQHWEFSNDDGKTWTDIFDGYYSHTPPAR